jgi:hypothetical protein
MEDQSIRKYLRSGNSRVVTASIFIIGFIVVLLFSLWTASHNIPLMTAGTDTEFRIFGAASAVVGEIVLMSTYVLLFFTGGRHRWTVFAVHVAMIFILLTNSIVRYAELSAHSDLLTNVVNFYGSYIAPIPVLLASVFGLILIVHFDPNVQQRHARQDLENLEHTHRMALQRWAQERMLDAMDSEAVKGAILEEAVAAAHSAGREVAQGMAHASTFNHNGNGDKGDRGSVASKN